MAASALKQGACLVCYLVNRTATFTVSGDWFCTSIRTGIGVYAPSFLFYFFTATRNLALRERGL